MDRLREAGHDPAQMDLPISLKIYVAPTDEEALRDAVPNALWFFHNLARLLPGAPGRPQPSG